MGSGPLKYLYSVVAIFKVESNKELELELELKLRNLSDCEFTENVDK